MLEDFLKTSEVVPVSGLNRDRHQDDNIWTTADSLQPAALSARWTVLSEQVERGGLFASAADTGYEVRLRLIVVVCCWGELPQPLGHDPDLRWE